MEAIPTITTKCNILLNFGVWNKIGMVEFICILFLTPEVRMNGFMNGKCVNDWLFRAITSISNDFSQMHKFSARQAPKTFNPAQNLFWTLTTELLVASTNFIFSLLADLTISSLYYSGNKSMNKNFYTIQACFII